mmetsp:Transcript_44080/g.80635  ORF Transcript_44080/g.80635 Transcript_44080/m.80635 type:complete len:234 (-) Transcript_44080:127-828(-)
MTMRVVGLVLICLSFEGYGFRVPTRSKHMQGSPHEKQSLTALAGLLSGLTPSTGFTQAGQVGARSHMFVRPPASVLSPLLDKMPNIFDQQQRVRTPRMVDSQFQLTSRRSSLRQAALTAAAALIAGSPLVAHADYGDDFDMEACLKRFKAAPNICTVKKGGAKAEAQNQARLARVAQCDAELELKKNNNGVLPESVMPATKNPSEPASCVGKPTYQLTGCGDPKLPVIYCKDK